MGYLKPEKLNTGETVSAVLRNVKTGMKRVIDGTPKPEAKYRVEIIVTDIKTGELIHRHEETR